MQLEAIYDDGKLQFTRPVRFAHRRFIVRVDVPEQELFEPEAGGAEETLTDYANQWLRRLEAIRKEVCETPEEDLPPVTGEQLERLRALGMRKER